MFSKQTKKQNTRAGLAHPSTGRRESNWNLTFRALTPSLTGADMNGGEWQIVCIRPVPGWSLRLCLGFKCTPLTFPLKGQVLCSLRRPPIPIPLPLTCSQPWGCKLSSSWVMPIYRCRLSASSQYGGGPFVPDWLKLDAFCATAELKKDDLLRKHLTVCLNLTQPTAEYYWKHKTHLSLSACVRISEGGGRERKKAAAN